MVLFECHLMILSFVYETKKTCWTSREFSYRWYLFVGLDVVDLIFLLERKEGSDLIRVVTQERDIVVSTSLPHNHIVKPTVLISDICSNCRP